MGSGEGRRRACPSARAAAARRSSCRCRAPSRAGRSPATVIACASSPTLRPDRIESAVRGPDAGDLHELAECRRAPRREKAVQHLRVLAHHEVREQRDALAERRAGCRTCSSARRPRSRRRRRRSAGAVASSSPSRPERRPIMGCGSSRRGPPRGGSALGAVARRQSAARGLHRAPGTPQRRGCAPGGSRRGKAAARGSSSAARANRPSRCASSAASARELTLSLR